MKLDTLITYAATGVNMGSGLLIMFLVNSFSGVEMYGMLTVLVSSAMIVNALATMRSGEAIVRFYVREKTRKKESATGSILLFGFGADTIGFLLACLILWFLAGPISQYFLKESGYKELVFLFGLLTSAGSRPLPRAVFGSGFPGGLRQCRVWGGGSLVISGTGDVVCLRHGCFCHTDLPSWPSGLPADRNPQAHLRKSVFPGVRRFFVENVSLFGPQGRLSEDRRADFVLFHDP